MPPLILDVLHDLSRDGQIGGAAAHSEIIGRYGRPAFDTVQISCVLLLI